MNSPSRVFCSYAHEDVAHFAALREQLAALRHSGCIQMWSDREIKAGERWNQRISDELEAADVVLMLISPSFIASDYCFEIEMKRALELSEQRQIIALPILVRACDWESMPFAQLQMMPRDLRPIASRPENERDEAWAHVAISIRTLLGRHNPQRLVKLELNNNVGVTTEELILHFLCAWPQWGFNVTRIRNWGGCKSGFEELGRESSQRIQAELDHLLALGKITSFKSKSGTTLYKARRE